jgi:DNA-directed RNA polymerase beta' subunit
MWPTIKDIGFSYATRSGYTIAVSDITVPPEKAEILNQALQKRKVVRDFRRGLLTEQEQNERVIEIWQRTTKTLARRSSATWTRTATWRPWQLWRYQGRFRPHLPAGRYARSDG